jgi:Concanavalin A-like lectin/glucanases superfamily
VTATPPKPSLVKTTALSMAQAVTDRLNALLPTVPSAESPVTVYQAGTLGVGGQLSAPTSVFPAGSGYYGVWTAPDLNNGNPYTVQVECFGGGGGGGGGSTTTGGGGGGGAEYARETYYPVRPGTNYVWVVGVPGSAGTANSDNNQGATAGGTGGTTVFDIAGTGVAGGVVAHGGQGGDVGNTGIGGTGGSGSINTTEWGGGAGGTNLPGTGGGSGGQGGTDNPVTLSQGGMLTGPPLAWYLLNDASSNGQLNDNSGNDNTGSVGSPSGGGGFSYAQAGAPSQVPAYSQGPNPPSSPNAETAATQLQFTLSQLTSPSAYFFTPGYSANGSQFTISGWFTPDPTGTWGNTATGARAVLTSNCSGYANSTTAGVALYLKNLGTPANPNWELVFYCASSHSAQTVTTPLKPVAGTAVYVVATFGASTMTLYVNGTQAGTASTSFSSVPGWPSVPYSMMVGVNPSLSGDWFFGFMSNLWFADGVLDAAGVTQAFSGTGGSSTEGGAGGGASGGPAANGGAGAAGSGSTGGAGGTPATQPATDIGLDTPASAGIAGAAGGSGNSGITGAAGAGGGGAGSSSAPPVITTVQVPFITAASYCGTDAGGGAAGAVYNPVIQGTTGRLFTGGLATDTASGSKNSLLVLPPNLAATLQSGNYTVLRVTLTVFNANPQASQDALMQVGWAPDTFLPITYEAGDIAGSAGVVEIPAASYSVTADLTESQLGLVLQSGTATSLVLGPGSTPTFAAYNADTAADFYTAIYGPGATDNAGNSLQPYLTITYAQSATVQQGSPGGAGAILLTYLNQAQTLVGTWNAADGINASGGQLTETTVVLGSTIVDATLDREARRSMRASRARARALGDRAGRRLGAVPGAPGTLLGYTAGTTTVTESTPGTYTFTVPAGVTTLNIQCWGAGAGGTGGGATQGQAGGGGGAYSGEPAYAVSPGDIISYVVGAGGAGDHVGTSSSPDGGNTQFDTTGVAGSGVLANGGQAYNGSINYGPGGSSSGNTVSFAGGNGGPLSYGQSNGSGGGGSGGSTGNGGGGSQGGGAGRAGNGGGEPGGAGARSGSGTGGTGPGGGGGGAGQGSTSYTGGSGGAGQVLITYASSTALATSIATSSGNDAAGNPYPAGVMTPALQVNGTTTTQNQTVSNTTTTNVLAVTTNATVGGNHTVTGNVAVGGVISGASGGALENTSGIHTSGSLVADTQVVVNGGSGTAPLEVSGGAHITGALIADTSISTSGGGTFSSGIATASMHSTGNVQIDGSLNGGPVVVGGQGTPGGYPISTGTAIVSGSAPTTGFANFLNDIIIALQNAGLM